MLERLEQERRRLVGDAVAPAMAKLEAENAELKKSLAILTQLPDMRVDGVILEHRLMKLVHLDPERHGRLVLTAIQTSLVIAGLIEQGNMRRAVPPENARRGPDIYTSLFDRLRLEQANNPSPEVISQNLNEPRDLFPKATETTPSSKAIILPPIGESITLVKPKKTESPVITVEVG
jgi:hypothetical protein